MKDSVLRLHGLDGIEKLIKIGNHEEALRAVFHLCSKLVAMPELRMNKVHAPDLDRIIQNIGEAITKDITQEDLGSSIENGSLPSIIIATEIYKTGGHTRVIRDIAENIEGSAILVLTDLFGKYSSGSLSIEGIIDAFPKLAVVVMPRQPLTAKIHNLTQLILTTRARNIIIAAHHQDVVAYACCNKYLKKKQIYIHHADHNPTLGATVRHYIHTDLIPGIKRMCETNLSASCQLLPLTAQHIGNYQVPDNWATATAGSFEKFTVTGEMSYPNFIQKIIATTGKPHYHFGPIPEDALSLVRENLAKHNFCLNTFIHVPYVPTLSEALRRHPIGVYITSAPITGFKALVEALAAGIPILSYSNNSNQCSTVDHYLNCHHYKSLISWSTIRELQESLESLDLNQASSASTDIYRLHHSKNVFREALACLLS